MREWKLTLRCGTVIRYKGTANYRPGELVAIPFGRYHGPTTSYEHDGHRWDVETSECERLGCAIVHNEPWPAEPPAPALPEVGSVWRPSGCGHDHYIAGVEADGTVWLNVSESATAWGTRCFTGRAEMPWGGTGIPFGSATVDLLHEWEWERVLLPHPEFRKRALEAAARFRAWAPVERPEEPVRCEVCDCTDPTCSLCEDICRPAKARAAAPPPPEEPDQWHGWSLGDLRMERDRRRRTESTSQELCDAARVEWERSQWMLKDASEAVAIMDRAIGRRKAAK